MGMNMHEIGGRTRQLREKTGLAQEQVATYLHVGKSWVAGFGEGEHPANSVQLEQLSALFCCPAHDMVSRQCGHARVCGCALGGVG